MALSYNKQDLLIGRPIARLGLSNKVDGRDCIPSPYLKGYLDKFLNGQFIPSFETARGCPFSCTFCDQGIDTTKMVSFSTKRMEAELSYVCERVTKFPGSNSIAFHDFRLPRCVRAHNPTLRPAASSRTVSSCSRRTVFSIWPRLATPTCLQAASEHGKRCPDWRSSWQHNSSRASRAKFLRRPPSATRCKSARAPWLKPAR